jgi:CBS domain containing-hemolysin-like protein
MLEAPLSKYLHNEFSVLILQTLLSTLIILVTAEFLPKAIFRLMPNATLNFFSIPLIIVYILLYPITKLLIFISKLLLKLFFKKSLRDANEISNMLSKVDLDYLMQEVLNNKHLPEHPDHEIQIFQNALDFSEVKIRDCMIPRTEIVAIDDECSVEELLQKFIETGFSKILIYHENIDNIIGYVSSKEMFKHPKTIKSKLITPVIVPETMNANKLLQMLLKEHKSLALVVDEYGGTSGIITIEDIMEEIFGEIEDEHDTIELVEKRLDKGYIFSGKISIEYVNTKYQFDITESTDYDTLAGYIFHQIGRIPAINEVLEIENFSIKIIKIQNNRLELIYFKKNEE